MSPLLLSCISAVNYGYSNERVPEAAVRGTLGGVMEMRKWEGLSRACSVTNQTPPTNC